MNETVGHLRTRVGEPFTIRFRSGPAAGGWQALYDPGAVKLVGRTFQPDPGGVGGTGEEVLTFQATRAGHVAITLALTGPGEKGSQDARVYEIDAEP
jgi:predicted secreted protein